MLNQTTRVVSTLDGLCSLNPNPESEREREMFYLTTHSTHFIYGYMASDIWLRTILTVRKETRCCHIDYSYRLTARVLLYAPSHRQENTYHGLCYTSRRALAGTTQPRIANLNLEIGRDSELGQETYTRGFNHLYGQ